MAKTYLDYQITSEDIAWEFLKLGIVIPLSFALVGGLINHYGKQNEPATLYVVGGMISIVFLILQGIAFWYFRHPNFYEFKITHEVVEYKTNSEGYQLPLASILRIETSRTIGGETSRIDYFFVTDSGKSFKVPKIHKLPDGKIVKIMMEANPAIVKN
ncbi:MULTISPECIES: hypothetical protein [Cellvibrio]|uniref:DUF304 domain-containing protein n=1 Tax=Cellvibrio fibrivorans TaxID=126350 RepID=A0ABU1UYK8_9GAMM|nr:hypothetical protein [Cellvibrio fibrivorans]MDR7090235.1 hypothetical protein [Cellvibrio fibrivorans]